jgi:hypothetical protein
VVLVFPPTVASSCCPCSVVVGARLLTGATMFRCLFSN